MMITASIQLRCSFKRYQTHREGLICWFFRKIVSKRSFKNKKDKNKNKRKGFEFDKEISKRRVKMSFLRGHELG